MEFSFFYPLTDYGPILYPDYPFATSGDPQQEFLETVQICGTNSQASFSTCGGPAGVEATDCCS